MKVVGAILLICASTLLGIGQARKLYFRQSCLAGVIDSLRFIDAELKNGSVSIPDIFSELSKLSNSKLRNYYVNLNEKMKTFGEESLSEIWSGCAMNDKSISLSGRERQELCRVGNYLGRYSEIEQSEAINVCISHLGEDLKRSAEKARQGAKLYTGLGLTFGLMLAAVLI
ncbi:MAG: stage III sporulation protein AB [Oscillospiraceae bacterium]|nr:stage III sporulation protein AB [Oscillospiraceae bacterium]